MQYHLNGFEPGDPDLADLAERFRPSGLQGHLPELADVLIVGSGPAGLVLAAQLAQFEEIRTVIVEQNADRLYRGRADGLACRSLEMFQAFGFADRVMREAYWVNEVTFWKPSPENPAAIARSGRVQDVEDDLSEMPHVILNQARVHDLFLDVMKKAPAKVEPYYGRKVLGLSVEEGGSHPVRVRLERSGMSHPGKVEEIKARFVVGCDGARSSVRQAIGGSLQGDSANQAWGVMDLLAVTDFPDIRMKCLIQSTHSGSIVIIPREGGYLVRLYVELDNLEFGERVAARKLSVEEIIAAANRILQPYTLDVKDVAWWSVYEIGQRITERFDNLPVDAAAGDIPRVFIAGDACHTHSPKAGQGMNVSMQDSFNLGWKLAAVLRGQSPPTLLRSYSEERRDVAQVLIDFDREWARIISAGKAGGIDPAETQRYFIQHGRYTAGTATCYHPSLLTGAGTHQDLAKGEPVGMRFHSAPVIRLADGKPVQLGHEVKADGRWRIFAFADAGHPAAQGSRIRNLCDFLSRSQSSPVLRHTPSGGDPDCVIDVRAIFQQGFRDLALQEMPPFLLPRKGTLGLIDYEKMFCADTRSASDIFDMRGIDRHSGCMIIVRPDQYIANVLPLEDVQSLAAYFDRVLISR
ncbi:UbiH 2-polyprenyl-6-methoxyphenol hydroxylase and related FAD-dependent oxidoreductases [Rhabdaerophilaceae bacterium]